MTLPVRRSRDDTARFDPFTELSRLQEQLAGYLDRWPRVPGLREGAFTPRADLEETDDAWVAEVELPGVEKDEVNIEASGRRLTVSGELREKQRVGKVRHRTRSVGQFRFELSVPFEIDPDQASASLEKGVLTVRLPKPVVTEPRRVPIN